MLENWSDFGGLVKIAYNFDFQFTLDSLNFQGNISMY